MPGPAKHARHTLLASDEERDLAIAWIERQDYEARNKLIMAYKPLAAAFAATVARSSDLEMWKDLDQVAMIAMMEAIDNYNPSHGNRFGAFARQYIKGALRHYVMDNIGITRVGTNSSDKKVFSRFRQLRAEIEQKTGEPLNDLGREEIAKRLKVSINVVRRMEPRIVRSDVSLNQPVEHDDESDGIGDTDIPDDTQRVEETVMRKHDSIAIKRILADMLARLSDEERLIVDKRIMANKGLSLDRLGERLGMTKRAVQRLELRTIRRMKETLKRNGVNADTAFIHS